MKFGVAPIRITAKRWTRRTVRLLVSSGIERNWMSRGLVWLKTGGAGCLRQNGESDFGVRRQSAAATPLWIICLGAIQSKAPSPLRSAGALQIGLLNLACFRRPPQTPGRAVAGFPDRPAHY